MATWPCTEMRIESDVFRKNHSTFPTKLKAVAITLAAFCFMILFKAAIKGCNSKISFSEKTENRTVPTAPVDLKKFQYAQAHLGTTVQIVFYTQDDSLASRLSQKCFERVQELNAVFSDYLDDSELSKLCNQPINQAHHVSEPLFTVIAQAQQISAKTHGAFDITVGQITQRWRRRAPEITEPESHDETINYQNIKLDSQQRTITLLKPLKLDLGGIAKGYIADQLMLLLKEAGLIHAAVIIGGETVLASAPPGKDGWRIGIEDTERKIIGTLSLENTCLSTSGDSYQFFEHNGQRLSHLIDPATKKSKTNRLNVTTIAPSAMEADAWATALRILPAEQSLALANQQPHLHALYIPHQETLRKTDRFPPIKAVEAKPATQ